MAKNKPSGPWSPVLMRFNGIEPEPVDWLWPGRLAVGKHHVLMGAPGLGKSWLSLDLAARISTGKAWPDGMAGCQGDVLVLSAEDGPSDTLRPRLDMLGANCSRVHLFQALRNDRGEIGYPMIAELAPIELAIRATQAKLLVIDPLTAYLGRTDSYKDAEVRGLLSPLADLADKRRIAILAIMHLNKSLALTGIDRIGGSVAFGAAARVVLAVVAMEDGGRLFGVIKNNLAPPVDAWTFQIQADVACGRFEWGEAREDLNIGDLLAQGSNSAGSPSRAEDTKLAEAIEEIFNRHDDRRVASSVLVEELGEAGFQISKITKREGRILRELGVTDTHW